MLEVYTIKYCINKQEKFSPGFKALTIVLACFSMQIQEDITCCICFPVEIHLICRIYHAGNPLALIGNQTKQHRWLTLCVLICWSIILFLQLKCTWSERTLDSRFSWVSIIPIVILQSCSLLTQSESSIFKLLKYIHNTTTGLKS